MFVIAFSLFPCRKTHPIGRWMITVYRSWHHQIVPGLQPPPLFLLIVSFFEIFSPKQCHPNMQKSKESDIFVIQILKPTFLYSMIFLHFAKSYLDSRCVIYTVKMNTFGTSLNLSDEFNGGGGREREWFGTFHLLDIKRGKNVILFLFRLCRWICVQQS